MATFTRGTAAVTLAECESETGQQELDTRDRDSLDWANLRISKTNWVIDKIAGRVKVSQITNAEVFNTTIAFAVVAHILLDGASEDNDRDHELGLYFDKKVKEAFEVAFGAIQLDTDGDSVADETGGGSPAIGWNSRASASRLSGTVGTPSGKITDAVW